MDACNLELVSRDIPLAVEVVVEDVVVTTAAVDVDAAEINWWPQSAELNVLVSLPSVWMI